MKIRELLKSRREKSSSCGQPIEDLEAEMLLAAVLKKDKEYILSHPEEEISFWQDWLYQRMIKKFAAGYSVAAIIGHKWFYGLDFIVNKNVLIPRPETELIVDEVMQKIKSNKLKVKNLIDIGTGSGCIIISLAKLLKDEQKKFYGLDISKKALAVAKKNAEKNGVGGCINFLYSDLLNVIQKEIFNEPAVIMANLPYLTPEQVENSPTIQKEPRLALLAGSDGLDCYRRLFKQINKGEIKKGLIVFCEIDETQRDLMTDLIKKYFPQAQLEYKNDLGGHCRMAIITL